jgi:hypothetical protein
MSDTDRLTDRLGELLEQAAPAHPDLDPTTRAATVARRGRSARNRNRVLVPVAVAAVVAVAVAVPISLGGGDGPDQATPAPPAPVRVEPCPGRPIDTTTLGPVSGLGDVAAVRACATQVPPGADELRELSPDALLTGAAAQAFADDVLALPAYEMPPYCMVANVMPFPWALQVQTTGGEVLRFGSPMGQCSSVSVDGVDRDVEQVIRAFDGNIDRVESGVPALACPTGDRFAPGADTWNASFNPATATAGIVCYRAGPMGTSTGNPEYARTEGTLDDGQLAEVRDDLVANLGSTPGDSTCFDSPAQRLIVLADADGDQTALLDQGCIGEFVGARGYWIPAQDAENAIAAALGGRVTR